MNPTMSNSEQNLVTSHKNTFPKKDNSRTREKLEATFLQSKQRTCNQACRGTQNPDLRMFPWSVCGWSAECSVLATSLTSVWHLPHTAGLIPPVHDRPNRTAIGPVELLIVAHCPDHPVFGGGYVPHSGSALWQLQACRSYSAHVRSSGRRAGCWTGPRPATEALPSLFSLSPPISCRP
uniref:Uncharacterized protein n=1 Tax=Anguilla anguilla TaxID=7936 RepID=A0A0E9X859_ANGAN